MILGENFQLPLPKKFFSYKKVPAAAAEKNFQLKKISKNENSAAVAKRLIVQRHGSGEGSIAMAARGAA